MKVEAFRKRYSLIEIKESLTMIQNSQYGQSCELQMEVCSMTLLGRI